MITGQAPCGNCDRLVTFALLEENEPCTHCEGRNWVAAPNQFCVCGEPFRWMHQPPPEQLEFAFTIELGEKVTR